MHESTREDCELFARVISVGVESVSGATDLRLGRERVTLLERERDRLEERMMYRWEGRGGVKEGRWKSRLALYVCKYV